MEQIAEFPQTTTFCKISGLPIQVDCYFGQKIRAAEHWIFSQNPAAIFKLALIAKTLQQKKLTQLAILKLFNAIIPDVPISISPKKLDLYHSKIVEIFTLWLHATTGQRIRLSGGFDDSKRNDSQLSIFPQYKISELNKNNGENYGYFIDILEKSILSFFLLTDLSLAKDYLNADRIELPEWEIAIEKELKEFQRVSPNRYSKKVGRCLLETLCEYPENTFIREQFQILKTYLLNDGFKTSENYAFAYRAVLDAHIEGTAVLEHRKLTLNWLQTQIEILLENEAGFFGKKNFIASTGQIENCSILTTFTTREDIDSFKTIEQTQNQDRPKMVFKLKPKTEKKMKIG